MSIQIKKTSDCGEAMVTTVSPMSTVQEEYEEAVRIMFADFLKAVRRAGLPEDNVPDDLPEQLYHGGWSVEDGGQGFRASISLDAACIVSTQSGNGVHWGIQRG